METTENSGVEEAELEVGIEAGVETSEDAGVEEAELEAWIEGGVETSEDAGVEEARLEAGVELPEEEIGRVTRVVPVAGAVPVTACDERLPVIVCDRLNE